MERINTSMMDDDFLITMLYISVKKTIESNEQELEEPKNNSRS